MIFRNKGKNENMKETREERFKRVASRRVQEILNKMRLLRNCSDKANYSYEESQVKKIFSTIDSEWKSVKDEFNKHKAKGKKFSLE